MDAAHRATTPDVHLPNQSQPLYRHYCVCVSRGEGVHVGEDEVAGAVGAELGLVFPADDGECAQNVLGVIPGEAIG